MLPLVLVGAMLTAPAIPRSSDARAMVRNINAQRHSAGARRLRFDDKLSTVAFEHARDMATYDYFGHLTLSGRSPFERLRAAHVRFGYAGEDLEFDRNVGAAEKALWLSPPHRANALFPEFRRIGVAALQTEHGEFVVEEFSD